jgi:prevent-host-death family protein
MTEIQVSMTTLRQNLGNLVNRAAYGDERIVLVAYGEPKAAIIGIEDLQRLKQINVRTTSQHDQYTQALAAADLLRERIRNWQTAHGIDPGDVVEDLRQLREEHDDQLAGLR